MLHRRSLEEQVASAVREFAASISAGRRVVSDMTPLVDATSGLPLSNLDYWERLIRDELTSSLQTPKNVGWNIFSKPSTLLTWLDLISFDGHRRERTLRTITGGAPNGFFFALAARRLNDWVPQVREAARQKLPLIASASEPSQVVEALCVTLMHWSSWGRIEASDRQVLLDIISEEKMANALVSKITLSASGPMVSILAQAGRTSTLDKHLNEIAEKAIQPSVRAKAYRSLFEGKMTWIEGRKWEWTDIRYCQGKLKPVMSERAITVTPKFLDILRKASVDRSSIVRRVAAEMLIRNIENLGDEAARLASIFSKDESHSVSEQGAFVLRKLTEMPQ